MRVRPLVLASFFLWMTAQSAWADGRRDIERGIQQYDVLELSRAREFLEAASTAGDLEPDERARALLYLGLIDYENGAISRAEETWRRAMALDLEVAVPPGTSPKATENIESVRRAARVRADAARAAMAQVPAGGAGAAASPPPRPEDEGGGWLLWAGIGGAVVLGAAVAVIAVVASSDDECPGRGGCVAFSVR